MTTQPAIHHGEGSTADIDILVAAAYDPWRTRTDLGEMRAAYDRMMPGPGADVVVTETAVNGVPGRWVQAGGAERTVLYLHGGGFTLGSSYGYRDLGARVARAARARVLLVDYALAPERPFPAGLDDVVAVYQVLVEQEGVDPRTLVLAGDSAGGGLTLSALLRLRDEGLPLPACALLLSPLIDLTLSGDTYETLADQDPICGRAIAEQMVGPYLSGYDPADPLASPLLGDLTGLPPLLIQVGGREVLLADSTRTVERARAAGVPVELEVEDGMVHVFHMFAARLATAQRAIDRLGAFARRHAAPGT